MASLQDISVVEIANGIRNGSLGHVNKKLPLMLSTKVVDHLKDKVDPTDERILKQLKEKLTLNCIPWDPKVFKNELKQLFFANKVTELDLSNLAHQKTFHSTRRSKKSRIFIDIPLILTKMLNPESCQSLHTLKIDGNKLKIPMGWIETLSNLLPSLESLSLPFCQLKNEDFQGICRNMPKLEHLSIKNTNVKNLNGIGSLTNLKSLCIADIKFVNAEDLNDLFLLRELITLDMSNEFHPRLKDTLKIFVACSQVLSKLKSIDISKNILTKDTIESFLNSHPTVKEIYALKAERQVVAFIRQRMTDRFKLGNFKLLADDTMEHCWASYEYYSSKQYTLFPSIVLETVASFLIWRLNEVSLDDRKYCVPKLLSLAEDSSRSYRECAWVCLSLRVLQDTDMILSHDEKQRTINYSICFLQRVVKNDLVIEREHNFLRGAWIILGSRDFTEGMYMDPEVICELCCKFICCTRIKCDYILQVCSTLFLELHVRLTDQKIQELLFTYPLKKRLFKMCTERNYCPESPIPTYLNLLFFLGTVGNLQPERHVEMNDGIIDWITEEIMIHGNCENYLPPAFHVMDAFVKTASRDPLLIVLYKPNTFEIVASHFVKTDFEE